MQLPLWKRTRQDWAIGVNINMISTSEIRVTVLINEKDGIRAMNAVHDAFGLTD